jgi:hypothetical protein
MKKEVFVLAAAAAFLTLRPGLHAQTPDIDVAVQDVRRQVQALADTHIDVDVSDMNLRVNRTLNQIKPKIALNMPMFVPDDWQGSFDADRVRGQYRAGTRAIDRHDYEKAIVAMDQVIAAKSGRVEGAYYWKAYAQSKLGRTNDALATLAALERNFPKSAWLKDAKALEVETRQSAGQKVSPDSESNDDLKLLAINGLMHSDPAQATPLVEKVLNDAKNAPNVRERALFVLARSDAPEARQTVMRFAEGNANPDLQMRAIQYLAASEGKGDASVFTRIYNQASDPAVKRSALQAMFIREDRNALAAVAKSDPNADLRRQSVRFLGSLGANDLLASLYRTESDVELKRTILDSLAADDDAKDLVALARQEKDAKLKRQAVERLSTMDSKEAKAYMLELLGK